MIQEPCPICGTSNWYKPPNGKFFECAKCTGKNLLAIASHEEKKNLNGCECGSSDYWVPIGTKVPKCVQCSPPPSERMIAMFLIIDDNGTLWKVIQNERGESLVRLDRQFNTVCDIG